MIKINLVPEDLQKKQKGQAFQQVLKGVPLEVLVGVSVGVIVFLVVIHIALESLIFVNLINHQNQKSEWSSIAPERERVDKVLENLDILRKKIDAVEKITVEQRISWSEKLNVISNVMPQGVWLEKISLSDNVFLIRGSAVSKKSDEMTIVGNFSSNLKKQKEFMDGLQDIEVGSIQRRNIQSTQVADFVISLKLDEKFNE